MGTTLDASLDHTSLETAVAAAREKEQANQLVAAVAAWESVRADFPSHPIGYAGCGGALRRLGRLAEANTVLSEAANKFPTDERVAAEHAWLAHVSGDWAEADRRWTALRRRHPGALEAYHGGGAVLRYLGRFDEADAVYTEAFKQWPSVLFLLVDFAAAAQARGDAAEASRRWRSVRVQFPDKPHSFVGEAQSLREGGRFDEAEAVIADAVRRFPDSAAVLIESARIAQHRGVPLEALKRWDAVATTFPGLADGYIGAAESLNQLGRFADAENVLQPALRMFPEFEYGAILNAWIPHYRREFSESLKRWRNLREKFPTNPTGFTGALTTLLSMGDFREAATLADQALQSFPRDIQILMTYASIPQYLQNGEEAQNRWAKVYEQFPASSPVQSGYAQALGKAGKWEEADVVLERAIKQNNSDINVLKTYADSATARRDWALAESRWRQIIDRFQNQWVAWSGLGSMLSEAGRFEESASVLKAGLARFPDNIDLERHRAWTATQARDWPTALRLWEELKGKYPRNPAVQNGISLALYHARQDLGAVTDDESDRATFEIPPRLLEPDKEDTISDSGLLDLFMKFESIGDTCEFGIVQRRFGAEPISLLRWASTTPANLVKALDSKFDGVGDAEHTIIAASHGEYISRDKRYHMFAHTFTPETAEQLDRFTTKHLRRMQFLRRKLIDDLAVGEKIFAYKCIDGMSDDDARAIHHAIRRYGARSALMCVRLEDASHARGTLETLEDGLFMGYIDRFSTVDINVDVWVDLCKKTEAAWSEKISST